MFVYRVAVMYRMQSFQEKGVLAYCLGSLSFWNFSVVWVNGAIRCYYPLLRTDYAYSDTVLN